MRDEGNQREGAADGRDPRQHANPDVPTPRGSRTSAAADAIESPSVSDMSAPIVVDVCPAATSTTGTYEFISPRQPPPAKLDQHAASTPGRCQTRGSPAGRSRS